MAGAEAQAGFYYQNIVAAQFALDLIEFGSRLRSLTLENPSRAKHIDDIIVESVEGTAFVQVKWSQDDTSPFTLHNLVTAEEDSRSLIEKLARGFRQVAREGGRQEIVLLSSRKPGINRQPGKGFDKSLAEFLGELHSPFIGDENITDIRQARAFDEYKPILDRLLSASGLQDFVELSRFFKTLRFRLNQPDRETMAERVRARLARLGIEQAQYATLLDKIVRWSIAGETVGTDDVRRALGLLDRFVDRLSHGFPVDRELWVPRPEVFAALDSSLGTLDSGFVLLEGEPGSGKSTTLAQYLAERPAVRFGYYCFIPNERTLGNERLGDDAFVRSICIGLHNAFPEFDFPQPYAPHTLELMNEWLHALSAKAQRVVFIVDGLDHVDRKNRQSLIARPLTSVLDGELPENVIIVLSSRYPEALPQRLRDHVASDPRRHIEMPRLGREQARQFFKVRGVGLADDLLYSAVSVSGGIPIYLEYLADCLRDMTRYEQERYLDSVPALRDKRIDEYHQHLWELIAKDQRLVYLMALLALREEFTTPDMLRDLLSSVGADSTLAAVHGALAEVRHVLRVSDAKAVAIRHSSLAEFVSERTEHLKDEINRAIAGWYAQNPQSDEAWRHRLRHLFHLGRPLEVLDACNDEWLERAWVKHRPIPEIQRNLDLAWRAAAAQQDLVEFIRIALLKQQIALVGRNLDFSESQLARLLLDMGQPDEALRRIWDGERPQCGPIQFADFSLQQTTAIGRTLPQHIVRAGLGDGPGSASAEGITEWYRASAHVTDPEKLLAAAGRIRWMTKDPSGHLRGRVENAEAGQINLNIQLAVVRELIDRNDLDALERISRACALPEAARTVARAGIGLVLARAGESSDAAREVRGLDVSGVPQASRRSLILELGANGLLDCLSTGGLSERPRLPSDLLTENRRGFNASFFDLYDQLRVLFLVDETGFPWLESAATGLAEPAKILVSALGRLARLWSSWVRKIPAGNSQLAVLKTVADDLDLDRQLFRTIENWGDLTESSYRDNAHRFYEEVWRCASQVLAGGELEELARWWARRREGRRAMRYPEATQALATAVYRRLGVDGSPSARELLELAERSARADEETSAIAPRLLACASAWGRCGFALEAQRLWRALLDVGCGVYWRKDYQFNEIEKPLKLAHAEDPAGTLKRVEEQLILAHQLEGTSQSKTVAVAIEGLIEFVSGIDPALALKMIEREEELIFRGRALRKVIHALLDGGTFDRRLLLSLAATLGPWENYSEFNDETKPTMFAVFSSALELRDFDMARKAYDWARHVLLVEKQMPGEVATWAATWVDAGGAPPDVHRDLTEYSAQEPNQLPVPPTVDQEAGDEWAGELEELAQGELVAFEQRFDEVLQLEIKRNRRRELERVRGDWRTALARAAGREWSEEEAHALDECLESLAKLALDLQTGEGGAARKAGRALVEEFLEAANQRLLCKTTLARFEEFFDIDEWLDGFLRTGRVPFPLEGKLKDRLPVWIAAAPLARIGAWEDFCRRRCDGETRAAGLLTAAERRSASAPERAVANLLEAWRSHPESFHGFSRSGRRICSVLLDLDRHKGSELLFESFREQFQRYPGDIIHYLDNLLDFAGKLPAFSAVRLYAVWSAYNRRLAAGLSEKLADFGWVTEEAGRDPQDACFRYLLGLFDYPVVDVRLLAWEELFRLVTERPGLIDTLLDLWPSLGDGPKEHVATLLSGVAITDPGGAERWIPFFVALGAHEHHYNIRTTISEGASAAIERGASVEPSVVAEASALREAPRIILPHPTPLLALGSETSQQLPPYLRWSLDVLSPIAPSGELQARVQAALGRAYPDPESGLRAESAVHRRYNINANFDLIEISGVYDRAVRGAINRAVYELLEAHLVDETELDARKDVLRLRDPTDMMARRVPRPVEVDWVDPGITDEEFLTFSDLGRLTDGYSRRNEAWVTLFEHTEQRIGERFGTNSHRVHKGRIILFGLPKGRARPVLSEIVRELKRGALSRLRNTYRFELVKAAPRLSLTGVVPLVVVSRRAFHGRDMIDLSAVVPGLTGEFGLRPDPGDLLGNVADGHPVVRSVEWQEAFDQGRRRHEPMSAGSLLQMRREVLMRIAEAKGLSLWAYINAERTTDRYKPEHEMDWQEHSVLFPIELN